MAQPLGSGAGLSSELDDKERFFHVCRLILEGGTELLRQKFDQLIPPANLPGTLQKEKANLLKLPRNVLTISMSQKLYLRAGAFGKSGDFDISLLMVLFRHLCGLKALLTSNNWGSMPIDSDKSLEADILQLKIYRVFSHAEACCISASDFNQISKNIRSIFVRLGGSPWKLKAETMLGEPLTQCENTYLKQLKEWHNDDTDMKEIYQELHCKTGQVLRLFAKQDGKIDQVLHQAEKTDNKVDQMLQQKQEMRENLDEISNRLASGAIEQVLYQTKNTEDKVDQMLHENQKIRKDIAEISSKFASGTEQVLHQTKKMEEKMDQVLQQTSGMLGFINTFDLQL